MSIKPEERQSAQLAMIEDFYGSKAVEQLKKQATDSYNSGGLALASMRLKMDRNVQRKLEKQSYNQQVNDALMSLFHTEDEEGGVDTVRVYMTALIGFKMELTLHTPATP